MVGNLVTRQWWERLQGPEWISPTILSLKLDLIKQGSIYIRPLIKHTGNTELMVLDATSGPSFVLTYMWAQVFDIHS